jgi:hypothetical protein
VPCACGALFSGAQIFINGAALKNSKPLDLLKPLLSLILEPSGSPQYYCYEEEEHRLSQ